MSLLSRLANCFRGAHLNNEIDEELRSHLSEAAAEGRDPQEAARAFGSLLRTREASRDVRSNAWIDSLIADIVFGWRQLRKQKTATVPAVLSLALAIGSCAAAFRLIDALLFRPLPVTDPGNLYVMNYGYVDNGHPETGDQFSYACFRQLRAAVTKEAELFAVSPRERMGLSLAADSESIRAYRQYVSGWMFHDLGLRAALGRVFTEEDDLKPGGHPYAMLSYNFWSTRLARDPNIVGKTFRSGQVYEVIGITPKGFTGTDTGGYTDVFYTTMSNPVGVKNQNWNWFRIWVRPRHGVSLGQVREQLASALAAFRRDQVKSWSFGQTKEDMDRYITAPVSLEHASAGVSEVQKRYKVALTALAALVFLVLLIACANVANLMIAQGTMRAREMALRISLGAGRWRLVELLLVESAILATCASALGALIAWRAAPLVVSMISSADDPVRLALPADTRVLTFLCVLAFITTLLFGVGPAFRTSGLKPASAFKGGDDPRVCGALMNGLVAAQVAFCVFVYHSGALFVGTFERMSNQPTGFSSNRVLTLETATKGKQPAGEWDRVTEHLRTLAGVESAALCWWPLMSGNGWQQYIWIHGLRSDDNSSPYFLKVSPGWLETMKITFRGGRDFRQGDAFPQVAIVNETFAKRFFGGANPIGRSFVIAQDKRRSTLQIVGYVADARYRDMREPIHATAYVPFLSSDAAGYAEPSDWASFVVRTKTPNPMALASMLRREVKKVQPSFTVVNVRTQDEMVQSHLLRERLLAALGLYFAGIAVTLAGAGMFGVLNYAMVRRRRELGIRLAVGAGWRHIAWGLMRNVLGMIALGALIGTLAGLYSGRFVETLLYRIGTTDGQVILIPLFLTAAVALLGATPPLMRAMQVDPAVTLREE